jgi:O-antigen ligase
MKVQGLPGFAACLLLLLPALALTTRFGMGLVQLCLLFSLLLPPVRAVYVRHFRILAPVLLAFTAYFLVSLWRFFAYQQNLLTLDGPSRLLFGLSCIGFVVCYKPPPRWFCLGLCLGAIGAAVIALVQRFGLGMERVDGFTHHPITFGDLALAQGLLALCTLSELRHTRWAALPWLALVSGLLVSVLSVSRGGWLALPLVAGPLWYYGRALYGRLIPLALATCLALAALAYAVPASGVAQRVQDAVSDVEGYWQHQDATTSVGIRLELWKASWLMFREHPWLGVGRSGFDDALQQLEQQGKLQNSPALTYSSSHNDSLHFLATGGLLDFSCLLLMYGAPLLFFVRVLQQPGPSRSAPALMGLVLVLCFLAFGLTDVMFWLMTPKMFYIMFTSVLIGLCLAQKENHD